MKKLFLDTNFIMDYFVREGFGDPSEQLMSFVDARKYKCYISFLTVANFAYITRKMPANAVRSMIKKMCDAFKVVKNTEDQISKALALNASDFEDALQYRCAKDAGCDCIITRNQKDFAFSDIPVLSASEYLEKYN
ncbi:PIN domain-containing protein [bacterium]|nr:PIN domain-containing protein [Bacteroides sp.]MBD5386422.1 PIN domain-containing protein [bacterium]